METGLLIVLAVIILKPSLLGFGGGARPIGASPTGVNPVGTGAGSGGLPTDGAPITPSPGTAPGTDWGAFAGGLIGNITNLFGSIGATESPTKGQGSPGGSTGVTDPSRAGGWGTDETTSTDPNELPGWGNPASYPSEGGGAGAGSSGLLDDPWGTQTSSLDQ